eukprot:1663738-Rhodomonas_salina.1
MELEAISVQAGEAVEQNSKGESGLPSSDVATEELGQGRDALQPCKNTDRFQVEDGGTDPTSELSMVSESSRVNAESDFCPQPSEEKMVLHGPKPDDNVCKMVDENGQEYVWQDDADPQTELDSNSAEANVDSSDFYPQAYDENAAVMKSEDDARPGACAEEAGMRLESVQAKQSKAQPGQPKMDGADDMKISGFPPDVVAANSSAPSASSIANVTASSPALAPASAAATKTAAESEEGFKSVWDVDSATGGEEAPSLVEVSQAQQAEPAQEEDAMVLDGSDDAEPRRGV